MKTIDCLPKTGASGTALLVIALILALAGITLAITVARRKRQVGKNMQTLLAFAIFGICLAATGSLLTAGTAQASSASDPCVSGKSVESTQSRTPTPSASATVTATSSATPTTTPEATPGPTETLGPEVSPTPEPEPSPTYIPANYTVSFPSQTFDRPPYGIILNDVLEVPPFTEEATFVIENNGQGDGTGTLILFFPKQESNYWTVTGLLDADGNPLEDVTVNNYPAGPEFTLTNAPTAGKSLSLSVVLQYNPDNWDRTLIEIPGASWELTEWHATVRPASTLSVQLLGVPSTNYSATIDIPESIYVNVPN